MELPKYLSAEKKKPNNQTKKPNNKKIEYLELCKSKYFEY